MPSYMLTALQYISARVHEGDHLPPSKTPLMSCTFQIKHHESTGSHTCKFPSLSGSRSVISLPYPLGNCRKTMWAGRSTEKLLSLLKFPKP